MNKLLKKNIFISILCLLLAIVLIPLSILGWFAVTDKNNAENFNLVVVNSDSSGNLGIVLNGNNPSGQIQVTTFLPGEYVYAELTVENVSQSENTYQLNISSISVTFPTSRDGFVYDDSYVFCNDYYHNDTLVEIDTVMTEEKFRRFITPVTDAMTYAVYFAQGEGYDNEYMPTYFTSGGIASSANLANANGIHYLPANPIIPISSAKPFEGQTVYGDNTIELGDGILWNTDGTVTLAAGKSIVLYLVLYFESDKYVTADVSDTSTPYELTLHNSNPYMKQNSVITLQISW